MKQLATERTLRRELVVEMDRIVVTEYPKSGGTWLVSMLGSACGMPCRDIYVSKNYQAFEVRRHPWYLNIQDGLDLPRRCVIKSHELPGSQLTNFDARFLHLVRDGRDVVVSRFFYERDFCVKNGIYKRFDESFDSYVPRIAAEWRTFVHTWLMRSQRFYRYEDFLHDPFSTLRRVLKDLEFDASDQIVTEAVEANSSERLKQALSRTFEHNTFVRKATSGDWRNYFEERHVAAFDKAAGEVLALLGYDRDTTGSDERRTIDA